MPGAAQPKRHKEKANTASILYMVCRPHFLPGRSGGGRDRRARRWSQEPFKGKML